MTLRTAIGLVFTTIPLLVAPLAQGCAGEMDHGHHHGAPAAAGAPGELEGVAMNGGVHLIWEDHCDDEDGFIILRRSAGAPFAEVGRTSPDAVTFHDRNVTRGQTYQYVGRGRAPRRILAAVQRDHRRGAVRRAPAFARRRSKRSQWR